MKCGLLEKTLQTSMTNLNDLKLESNAEIESLRDDLKQSQKKIKDIFLPKPNEQLEEVVDKVFHEVMVDEFTMKINYYRERERDH